MHNHLAWAKQVKVRDILGCTLALMLTVVLAVLVSCGSQYAPTAQTNGPRFTIIASQDLGNYSLTVVCDNTDHIIIYHASSGSIAVNAGDTRSRPINPC
jgi:hypothetical protein